MAGAGSVEAGEGGEIVDFVQIMKDWRRMCQFMDNEYGNSSCDNCPLGGCSAIYEMCGKENFANMERDISAWAAEHPEPVYPTWGEWLEKQGVVKTVLSPRYDENRALYYTPMYEITNPIPADIAQKLGLKPKEG